MKSPQDGWLGGLRVYVGAMALLNLAWEVLHLPLYTIWRTGSPRELAFAVLHCTAGDILIAIACLTLALIVGGERGLPTVAVTAIALGVAYAGFSEWMNVYVRRSWAYSELMPVVAVAGYRIGLSPLVQWVVVPAIAFRVVHRFQAPARPCRSSWTGGQGTSP